MIFLCIPSSSRVSEKSERRFCTTAKANSRGNHIQAPFATLEEKFTKLPTSVSFNIEMKYPMLSESEDEEMGTYAAEPNSFVDTVLTKVYDLGKGRNMIFSSFNPDICLLLSFKQPSIPVLLLTDSGTLPVSDARASSLQMPSASRVAGTCGVLWRRWSHLSSAPSLYEWSRSLDSSM
jgi:glycerophosphoryl diester phosphodiesterase